MDTEESKVQTQPKDQVITLNDSKAGMKGLDLEKINKIISETSEGSKFYEHKRKVKLRMEQKANEMKQHYERLSETTVSDSERKIDKIAAELESSRNDTRIIVHIDMDCFFAAVETRDNPALRNLPMAVGSNSMLSTSNYVARKYGVRAAMPGFIAKKLCPQLVIIPPDFEKYSAASQIAYEVYKQYDSNCYSCMDEASLDITEYVRSHLGPDDDEDEKIEETVNEIRHKVEIATNGLTCSAGISPTGFISKICSDMNKPNGQFRVKSNQVKNFINELKIRKVCGIGEATEVLLKAIGIEKCGDIWERRGAINLLFKPSTVDFLLRVSLGLGKHFFSFASGAENSSSTSSDDRKSISCERTFSETSNMQVLTELCQHLCSDLAEDLKSKECKGRAVAVKIKTDKFDVKTRIRTIMDYTDDEEVIFKTALSILESLRKEQEGMVLRLLGVRISTLKFKNQNEVNASSSSSSTKQFWQNFMEPENTFDCPICEKSFINSFSLRKHVDECLDRAENNSLETDDTLPTSSSCSTSAKRERPKETEASTSKLSEDFQIDNINQSEIRNKRLKMETCTGISSTTSAINSKPNGAQNTTKPKKGSPLKMMPIKFYFQNTGSKN